MVPLFISEALLVVDSGKYKFTKKLNFDIDFELVLATKRQERQTSIFYKRRWNKIGISIKIDKAMPVGNLTILQEIYKLPLVWKQVCSTLKGWYQPVQNPQSFRRQWGAFLNSVIWERKKYQFFHLILHNTTCIKLKQVMLSKTKTNNNEHDPFRVITDLYCWTL